jgi:hypothetical protein
MSFSTETIRIMAFSATILSVLFLSTTLYKCITWAGPRNYWRRYMHAGFMDYYMRPFALGVFHYLAIALAIGSLIAAPILYYFF